MGVRKLECNNLVNRNRKTFVPSNNTVTIVKYKSNRNETNYVVPRGDSMISVFCLRPAASGRELCDIDRVVQRYSTTCLK